jgi:hypothetical protein
MNLDDLTIGQARELAGMFGNGKAPTALHSALLGRYVVVRCQNAGVHTGILEMKQGQEVRLRNARRIWSWTQPDTNDGALSGVANHGVGKGSKVAGPVDTIELTDAIEVIATTDKAETSIKNAKWSS